MTGKEVKPEIQEEKLTDFQEIAESRDCIPYRLSNVYITKSIKGALFIEQVAYWYANAGNQAFYKIKEPCKSIYYNVGDSWCEELGMTRDEFDKAIKPFTKKIKKNATRDPNILVHYYTDFRRLTFYELNVELYTKLKAEYHKQRALILKEQYELKLIKKDEQARKEGKALYGVDKSHRKEGNPLYVKRESHVTLTREIHDGSNREHFTESTPKNKNKDSVSVLLNSLLPKKPIPPSNELRDLIKDRLKREYIENNELVEWIEQHVHNNKAKMEWDHSINGAIVLIRRNKFERPKGLPEKNYTQEHDRRKQEDINASPRRGFQGAIGDLIE